MASFPGQPQKRQNKQGKTIRILMRFADGSNIGQKIRKQ